MIPDLAQVSPGLWVAISILAAIQLTLLVTALISIVRRPAERINGGKLLWVLLVVLINTIGPILYFAIGRRRGAMTEPEPEGFRAAGATSVADELYGPRTDS